jgi:opacity protein-like surface antigen
MLPELPAPVLKPTIVAWHGAYAGVMVAGQSVRIERAHANTGVRQQQLKGLAGIVAGYNWRSKQGRNSEIYGVEADAMSLTRLNGHSDHEPDWLATVRARYGVTSGPTMVYATAGFSLTSHKLDLNGASRLYPGAVAGCRHRDAGNRQAAHPAGIPLQPSPDQVGRTRRRPHGSRCHPGPAATV